MGNGIHRIGRAEFLKRCGQLFALAMVGPPPRAWLTRPEPFPEPFPHPDPRPGITGERVLSAEALGSSRKERVLESYDFARTYPEIFDGLYCACRCNAGKQGHRSLLACFESMQPTGCGGCQVEGELVGKLAKQEKTLAEIRLAVDKAYG